MILRLELVALAAALSLAAVPAQAAPTKGGEDLARDVVRILRREIVRLKELGIDFIQLDEPSLSSVVARTPAPGETLDVDAVVIGSGAGGSVVAAALAAHGVFDFFHGDLIVNPGMPVW